MPNYFCAWGTCKSSSRKKADKNLKFVKFPNPRIYPEKASLWAERCGRRNFTIKNVTPNTFICEKHFKEGTVLSTKKNPDLVPFPATSGGPRFHHEEALRRPNLIAFSTPSTCDVTSCEEEDLGAETTNDVPSSSISLCQSTAIDSSSITNSPPPTSPAGAFVDSPLLHVLRQKDDNNYGRGNAIAKRTVFIPAISRSDFKTPEKIDVEETPMLKRSRMQLFSDEKVPVSVRCRTENSWNVELASIKGEIRRLKQQLQKPKVSDIVLRTMKSAKFYTGLTRMQRCFVWELLGEENRNNLRMYNAKKGKTASSLRRLSVEDQFLLCLVKLRRGYDYHEMGILFKQDRLLIARVVKSWLQLLYKTFKDFEDEMFLQPEDIEKPLPKHFRNKLLRNVTSVIDCTELFVQSSTNYRQQGHLFSTYKHHTTLKCLIAVSPSGACTFVSSCYEGSISDVEIVKKSGYLDHINSKHVILADRGFLIEKELAEKGAKLIIPPFLNGKDSFSLKETKDTKVIGKARVHIERFNQRLKQFKFLSNVISQKDFCLASQAVYVCSCLCNFMEPLAK